MTQTHPDPLANAPHHMDADDGVRLVLDRIEHLEDALAEAVLRSDDPDGEGASTPLTPQLDAVVDRMDALQVMLADIQAQTQAQTRPQTEAQTQALAPEGMDSRFDAMEAALADRLGPVEAALLSLSEMYQASSARLETLFDQLAPMMAAQSPPVGDDMTEKLDLLLARTETILDRPVPEPDLAPLHDTAARTMISQKSMSDRHSAQLAQVLERLTMLETHLAPGLGDGGVTPATAEVATAMRDAILARIAELEAAMADRQTAISQALGARGAESGLSGLGDGSSRLMVALQALHQSQETTGSELRQTLFKLSHDVDALARNLNSDAEARQAVMLQELSAIGEQVAAGPNGENLRAALARELDILNGWISRQEGLHAKLTELLDAAEAQGAGQVLETMLEATHQSFRDQLDAMETRLSVQMTALVSGAGEMADGMAQVISHPALPEDTDQLKAAIGALRRALSGPNAPLEDMEMTERALDLRNALAETLGQFDPSHEVRATRVGF